MAKLKDYDKTLSRLMITLTKLQNNERPTKIELAEEFNVSSRTILRDINERLLYFDIKKDENSRYYLDEGINITKSDFTLDEMITLKLSMELIKEAGSDFSKTTEKILKKSIFPKTLSPYYIKPTLYEEIDMNSDVVELLEEAILKQKRVMLVIEYNKKLVEPYKIMNVDGIWYLLAFEKRVQLVKTYMISKLQLVDILDNKYKLPNDLEETIEDVVSGYFVDESEFDVTIKVNSNISEYFKLRKQLPSQEIIEDFDDGSLLIKYSVTHIEDIDNIIKSWLPDVEVILPKEYKDKILQDLQDYIKRINI